MKKKGESEGILVFISQAPLPWTAANQSPTGRGREEAGLLSCRQAHSLRKGTGQDRTHSRYFTSSMKEGACATRASNGDGMRRDTEDKILGRGRDDQIGSDEMRSDRRVQVRVLGVACTIY